MASNNQHLRPPHPRRPPAGKSVSLLHAPRISKGSTPDQTIRSEGSSSYSLRPLIGKDDSGESSNADKWFDRSNNDVGMNCAPVSDGWSTPLLFA